ncbi:MAG: hypothetical protein WCJ33_08045, partial [Pseudomonadota bacterium]
PHPDPLPVGEGVLQLPQKLYFLSRFKFINNFIITNNFMDEKSVKTGLNIAASELFIAPLLAIGAVLSLEKILPEQMKSFKNFLAKIIEPHVKTFEETSGPALKAFDIKNKDELGQFDVKTHLPEKPYREFSTKQRAFKIADILTKVGLAFIFEAGAAFSSQVALNKILKTNINPVKTVAIDVFTHAVALGSFMTFLAPAVEPAKEGIANILMKQTGMEAEKAKDTARILTYVSAPGWLAFLASMTFGLSKHGQQK